MDAAWDVLDRLDGVENGVRAAYYGVAADYYKVRLRNPHATFLNGAHRPRLNTPPTTATPFFTSHASTQRLTCPQRNGWRARTISLSPPS